MLRTLTLLAILLAATLTGQEAAAPPASPDVNWQEEMRKGRAAVSGKDLDAARAIFEAVRHDALMRRDDAAGLAAVQMLTALSRSSGDWAKTEDWLMEALDYTGRLRGQDSFEAIDLLTDIAGVRRARQNLDGAAATLSQAFSVASWKREAGFERVARIATTIGLVQLEQKKPQEARGSFGFALSMWNQLLREDPDVLPALEMLAGLYRDASEYAEAEPLYARALRIRETAFGMKSPEVIVGLDNLAYVRFGLQKFAEAEPLYQRLIELWQETGGPDHPMLALTLDKAAEFYSAQKRFAEADGFAKRAADIRASSLIGSLRLRARLAAQSDQPDQAIGYSEKAVQVMDLAGLPKPEQKILPAPANATKLPPARPRPAPKPKSSSTAIK